ncbi:rho GTPase-activating protein 6-like isoform X1 [Osmerus mordax]|uniref:rho GTPase-activating protein 6-like isoform X1 n=1 Tax=Osmerus mordax TaxID=8014 RepID=UPI00350FD69E
MSTQGLLSSVFSCSSPNSKTMSKRKLRQTRSLDAALIRHYGSETDEASMRGLKPSFVHGHTGDGVGGYQTIESYKLDACLTATKCKSPSSNLASLDASHFTYINFDYDSKATKRNTAWDLPFLARSPATTTGNPNTLFKWLQKKPQPSFTKSYAVWKSEGDFTWNSMSGRSVRLKPVPLQSLSELERDRLQDVAFNRLLQDYDLNCQITIPKDGQKRKKSLRTKLDSLAKEKSKDKDSAPQAFGIPLSQVISNDRLLKQRPDPQQEEPWDPNDLVTSFLHLTSTSKRLVKELSSSNSSLSSTSETPNELSSPNTPEPRTRRRGGVSVDCITDLDDNQSRLLEALQLSLPTDTPSNKKKHRDKKLSLNPIYRQVPRVVDSCCQHLEKYGLQTVGIFRVGSSKKRVRQLREEYDQGVDMQLEEEQCVHDVAALLKEFLRDMPDPLLTRELYTPFINTTSVLDLSDQEVVLQLLVYLLPPCNSDTLQRLLHFLATVAAHADDRHDRDRQEITGNKMTSLNLATIFGPNVLHKQKSSDKEFAVQSIARAEESTAIIGVVQRMINTHQTLFMVPPDLQNEVLMSLLETDPDVVDYLLRRKASQSSVPGVLRADEAFSLHQRRPSSDSNKASSGEVSPYDNNSPVLSDRLLQCQVDRSDRGDSRALSDRLFRAGQGDGRAEWCSPVGYVKGQPGETCIAPDTDRDTAHEQTIWGAWHATLRKEFMDHHFISGCQGDLSECSSQDSSEKLSCHQGNSKPPVRRTQTSLGVPECRPHPPVTRCSSSPHGQKGTGQLSGSPLLHQRAHSQSGSGSSEDLTFKDGPPVSPSLRGRARGDGRPPPPYPGLHRVSPVSTPSHPAPQHGYLTPQTTRRPPPSLSPVPQIVEPRTASGHPEGTVPRSPQWQRDKWQIWQLLSPDNADTLPETLV